MNSLPDTTTRNRSQEFSDLTSAFAPIRNRIDTASDQLEAGLDDLELLEEMLDDHTRYIDRNHIRRAQQILRRCRRTLKSLELGMTAIDNQEAYKADFHKAATED